jgi:hypothetical protein
MTTASGADSAEDLGRRAARTRTPRRQERSSRIRSFPPKIQLLALFKVRADDAIHDLAAVVHDHQSTFPTIDLVRRSSRD